ncbi:MAG: nicotinate-nucleotide adenylyltransferase, partial [Bacteroidetes bacterium]|nr:nicotinate-nucleotide adenylyltransferase [Bacteroidota bacterium]
IYLVTYGRTKGAKKMYKLFLEKGDEKKRVKTDDHGKFI